MKKHLKNAIPVIFAILVFAACSKDGGGDGTNPFGGGGTGGGNNAALVGKWSSVSATGTVGYSGGDLSAQLANAVNQNITTYDLLTNKVVVLDFESNGKASLYDLGELLDQGTWAISGSTVKIMSGEEEMLSFTAPTGNEFTIAGNNAVTQIISWEIGDFVLRNNGYDGMVGAGVQISSTGINLNIKFQKQ